MIRNKLVAIIFPVRVDLSGLPFGFLWIWKPDDQPREFGFYVPSIWTWLDRLRGIEKFELSLMSDEKPRSHDWREWPVRHVFEYAVERQMKKLSPGHVLVSDTSRYDRRPDLSGSPWQMYRSIAVKRLYTASSPALNP